MKTRSFLDQYGILCLFVISVSIFALSFLWHISSVTEYSGDTQNYSVPMQRENNIELRHSAVSEKVHPIERMAITENAFEDDINTESIALKLNDQKGHSTDQPGPVYLKFNGIGQVIWKDLKPTPESAEFSILFVATKKPNSPTFLSELDARTDAQVNLSFGEEYSFYLVDAFGEESRPSLDGSISPDNYTIYFNSTVGSDSFEFDVNGTSEGPPVFVFSKEANYNIVVKLHFESGGKIVNFNSVKVTSDE